MRYYSCWSFLVGISFELVPSFLLKCYSVKCSGECNAEQSVVLASDCRFSNCILLILH